ncbi:unnamed protein product [Rotaria sp. Silwood2]|nr:unnamed protein product [Rotaria sp. Silwood2]
MTLILYTCFLLLFVTVVTSQGEGLVCGQNELFSTCGSPCIETCTYKPEMCMAMCDVGCFCKNGYVRASNEAGSPCIKQEECGKANDTSPCGENEEFLTCGSACPPTCKDWSYPLPKPAMACIAMCVTGCFCKEGFYRSKEGKCVRREQCCGNNEVFTDCGTACVETCNYQPEICTEQCVTGCYCRRPDYVRINNSTNSVCIPRNQCPK